MPEKFIYFLYRLLLLLLTPVALVYALGRVIRNPAYARTLPQRLGFLPRLLRQSASGSIWIHAVSVGEVIAAGTLIAKLQETCSAPVFLSTTTLAGYRAACERLSSVTAGCFYAPLDYVFSVRRVVRTLRPSVVVVLETEIWPNLFREVKRAGCGLVIANGRISDRAFPAYRRWRFFFRAVLRWPDAILVQSSTMRERFVEAGASADRVEISGNLKFDFVLPAPDPESPVKRWIDSGSGPVLIAASTTVDDETDEAQAVIDAFQQLPGWRLILAPRKPERFDEAAKHLSGISFWRRSESEPHANERVLLLDTIGELPSLFPYADVVFIGGTFTSTEGHNFVEPALAGKPVIVGPRLKNFQEAADDFRAHDAFLPIGDPSELPRAIQNAFDDSQLGVRAKQRAEANRGAVEKTAAAILNVCDYSFYFNARPIAMGAFLAPFAKLWEIGSAWRLNDEYRNQRNLLTPVISIGNITTGGTGKTPHVLHLTRRFCEAGLEPLVLTRGYGRISHREQLILPRGSKAAVWHTGDEPQILLRSGYTALGVGRDRYLVGQEAEDVLKPDVFVLDDGFSHQRVARDVEIVLIDALDPFGGGELVPLGRLREPLEELRRADVFIITRCMQGRSTAAIESRLRALNSRAPIFRSRFVPREWISAKTGVACWPPFSTVAFCGLANPESFWKSIEQLGMRPHARLAFDDHHQYAPRELQRLVSYADSIRTGALLTTEKDVVNFPEDAESIFADLPVFWLRFEIEIENESDFLKLVNPADIRARQASNRRLGPGHR